MEASDCTSFAGKKRKAQATTADEWDTSDLGDFLSSAVRDVPSGAITEKLTARAHFYTMKPANTTSSVAKPTQPHSSLRTVTAATATSAELGGLFLADCTSELRSLKQQQAQTQQQARSQTQEQARSQTQEQARSQAQQQQQEYNHMSSAHARSSDSNSLFQAASKKYFSFGKQTKKLAIKLAIKRPAAPGAPAPTLSSTTAAAVDSSQTATATASATTAAAAGPSPLKVVYTLSPSQLRAREAVASGANCFLTGSAGTGKSQVTRAIMQYFSELYADPSNPLSCSDCGKVALTATTGIAAVNLSMGARTFFSALKLNPWDLERYKPMELALKLKSQPWVSSVICKLRHLILDEASMLSASMLDLLNDVFCVVRNHPKGADGRSLPFGGMQMVLIGDVLQLPPVPKKGTPRGTPKEHVFKANSFKTGDFRVCLLTETFRQTDPVFVELLGRARFGEPTDDDLALLNTRVDVDLEVAGVKPTILYCTNRDVTTENESRLAEISEPAYQFTARQAFLLEPRWLRADKETKLKKEAVLHGKASDVPKTTRVGKVGPKRLGDTYDGPSVVTLKVGAQVQLAANLDIENGLANGTKGVLTGFMTPDEWNQRQKDLATKESEAHDDDDDDDDNDKDGAAPVSTAVSETFTNVETDSEKAFFAPSAKSGAGAAADTFLYPKEKLPVVRFLVPSTDPARRGELEEREMLVPYWRWVVREHELGEAIVSQIPLRLAWATTIHSSQGLTLSLVRINLEGVFEPGQAYVALSRATTLAGMSLVAPIVASQLYADAECVEFSRGLTRSGVGQGVGCKQDCRDDDDDDDDNNDHE